MFLTGGDYTENQNSVSGNKTLLDTLPIQLVFSTDESAWSAQFEADAPAIWQIVEYADGAHGTNIFNAAPESMDAVANFLAGALAPG